ncbi:putative tyrosine protein phosphatase SIW14 [Sugiyamaella lignohabitans]|uniref:diphosphoinositol-polyphosphate diphosphatase n=1 Tax=Sugiyamaella lignohabitans TaxID=796027 RepID=A0A167DN05_9ASCO|nr:putative tyrosine protein phosphatase SIW14 [Sugiyamaella lignohabitans]ANB13089.1 putative tyrosine protein phosphatase SIW14 [Sugiyamaella lignohabitans]
MLESVVQRGALNGTKQQAETKRLLAVAVLMERASEGAEVSASDIKEGLGSKGARTMTAKINKGDGLSLKTANEEYDSADEIDIDGVAEDVNMKADVMEVEDEGGVGRSMEVDLDGSDKREQSQTQTQQSEPTIPKTQAADPAPPPLLAAPNSLYCPPNFGMVLGSIYRSSFPRPENFAFLKKLGLKSVLVLIPEPYPEENLTFLQENGIQFFQVGMSGNKEPFVHVSHATITKALEIALNPANHPLLIHCNRGKHRTGCLVGCIRRLQDWSLTMIFDEYRRFAFPKTRPLDQQLIELYDDSEIYERASRNNWLTFRF